MTFTEDEAKARWCPFARAQRGDGTSGVNRDTVTLGADVDSYCLASACMAWRWGFVRETDRDDPKGLPGGDPLTGTDLKYVTPDRKFLPLAGFCGLVGRPE